MEFRILRNLFFVKFYKNPMNAIILLFIKTKLKKDFLYKRNQFRTLFEQVFDQFDTDASGSLSKDEIKYGCNCLGLKAWDIDEFFVGLDENADGEISLSEFKDNLPSYVFKAMATKLTNDGLIEGF